MGPALGAPGVAAGTLMLSAVLDNGAANELPMVLPSGGKHHNRQSHHDDGKHNSSQCPGGCLATARCPAHKEGLLARTCTVIVAPRVASERGCDCPPSRLETPAGDSATGTQCINATASCATTGNISSVTRRAAPLRRRKDADKLTLKNHRSKHKQRQSKRNAHHAYFSLE